MTRTVPASCHVHALGAAAARGLLWRRRGALQLTVVAKGRFAFQHDRVMIRVQAPSIAHADMHHDGDPARSLLRASDLVPFRPRIDVTLSGHACAPGGRPVRSSAVRLGLFREAEALIDKVVHVYGERAFAGAQPEPFERMPLTYERAFGGPGCDENPVGVGAAGGGMPNLVDPERPDRPIGFGPLAASWKRRRQWVTRAAVRKLAQPVPVVDEVDWRYFQAAPRDQQIAAIRGDEWLVLDGMDPTLLRLTTRLPEARASARWFDGEGPGESLAMVLDAIAIDVDAHEVTFAWRAVVALPEGIEVLKLRVAAGVEAGAPSLDWDDTEARNRELPTIGSTQGLSPWVRRDLDAVERIADETDSSEPGAFEEIVGDPDASEPGAYEPGAYALGEYEPGAYDVGTGVTEEATSDDGTSSANTIDEAHAGQARHSRDATWTDAHRITPATTGETVAQEGALEFEATILQRRAKTVEPMSIDEEETISDQTSAPPAAGGPRRTSSHAEGPSTLRSKGLPDPIPRQPARFRRGGED
ncbi:MAG: DUF2169 domain-containing protein [Myxococcales bacterium]|nr:DUF2169 domain-containing protein [Myxococcales bacterium]